MLIALSLTFFVSVGLLALCLASRSPFSFDREREWSFKIWLSFFRALEAYQNTKGDIKIGEEVGLFECGGLKDWNFLKIKILRWWQKFLNAIFFTPNYPPNIFLQPLLSTQSFVKWLFYRSFCRVMKDLMNYLWIWTSCFVQVVVISLVYKSMMLFLLLVNSQSIIFFSVDLN